MLHYALVFLVVGLIAAALGLSGVAGVATQISWVLFLIAIILFVVHLVGGRRTPPGRMSRLPFLLRSTPLLHAMEDRSFFRCYSARTAYAAN